MFEILDTYKSHLVKDDVDGAEVSKVQDRIKARKFKLIFDNLDTARASKEELDIKKLADEAIITPHMESTPHFSFYILYHPVGNIKSII